MGDVTQELYAIVTGLMVFACVLRWLTWKTIKTNTEKNDEEQ